MSGHYSVREIKYYIDHLEETSQEDVEWCFEVMEHMHECSCCKNTADELLRVEALQEEEVRKGLFRVLENEELLHRQMLAAKLRIEQGEQCTQEQILAILRGEQPAQAVQTKVCAVEEEEQQEIRRQETVH